MARGKREARKRKCPIFQGNFHFELSVERGRKWEKEGINYSLKRASIQINKFLPFCFNLLSLERVLDTILLLPLCTSPPSHLKIMNENFILIFISLIRESQQPSFESKSLAGLDKTGMSCMFVSSQRQL